MVALLAVCYTLCIMRTIIKIARSQALFATALVSLLSLAACGGEESGSGKQDSRQFGADARIATHSQGNPPSMPGSTTVAGVTFAAPSHWKNLEASGMRQAQFRLPALQGDTAEAEVNVFYFGPQSGGGVQANLDRWIGQITLKNGSDPATAIERGTFTANGMPGHVVSLNGSYNSGGGRPMGGEGQMLPGYRLVGVVLEGPQGSVFFKLTGPETTARVMEGDLMRMVNGARQ